MLGYVAFLAILFLPGLATLLVFRQERVGLASLLARSYGLSLVLNSLVGFVTSFAALSFQELAVAQLLVSSAIVLALGVKRYRSQLRSMPAARLRSAAPALLVGVLFGTLVLLEFVKYPIFPKTYSVDFGQHVGLVQSALTEGLSLLSWAFMYGGVHSNLALGLALEGGNAFTQVPVLMALLAAPSSLLVYDVASMLYGGEMEALLAQVLYVVTGFVWYVPLYDSGLYPNLFSIFISMAYLAEVVRTLKSGGRGHIPIVVILTLGLYLSHYSVVLLIAAVDLYLLVLIAARTVRPLLALALIAANLLPASLVLLRPDLTSLASQLLGATGSQGAFTYSTPVSSALSFSPFLGYLSAEVFGYADLLLLVFALPLALYFSWRRRKESPFLPLVFVWLVLIWALSPQGEIAWRFAYQALAALVILAPATLLVVSGGFARLLPGGASRRRPRRPGQGKGFPLRTGAIVVLVIIAFSGSWTYIMLGDVSSGASSYSRAQGDLYNSMLWFESNTSPSSQLLSVTDWRAVYLQQLTGHVATVLLFANASSAVSYAKTNGIGYILLTYLVPSDIPTGFDPVSFYGSYQSSSSLKLVFNSTYSTIYEVE